MMTLPSRPRLVFVVFYLTAVLIFTIHLRTAKSRVFNQYCKAEAQQKILRQELRSLQLRFEALISPRRLLENLPAPTGSDSTKKKKPQ
jgi:hypothetical protein